MKIGLVLGGGGARGYAHIGVLKSLEKRGLEPVAIAGCSMGGLVGALIAWGYDSQGILDLVTKIKPWNLLDVGKRGALIGGRGMAHEMGKYLPETFEELNIPLAVTTVDLQEGKLAVFTQGPLLPALREGESSEIFRDDSHFLRRGAELIAADIVAWLTTWSSGVESSP